MEMQREEDVLTISLEIVPNIRGSHTPFIHQRQLLIDGSSTQQRKFLSFDHL